MITGVKTVKDGPIQHTVGSDTNVRAPVSIPTGIATLSPLPAETSIIGHVQTRLYYNTIYTPSAERVVAIQYHMVVRPKRQGGRLTLGGPKPNAKGDHTYGPNEREPPSPQTASLTLSARPNLLSYFNDEGWISEMVGETKYVYYSPDV